MDTDERKQDVKTMLRHKGELYQEGTIVKLTRHFGISRCYGYNNFKDFEKHAIEIKIKVDTKQIPKKKVEVGDYFTGGMHYCFKDRYTKVKDSYVPQKWSKETYIPKLPSFNEYFSTCNVNIEEATSYGTQIKLDQWNYKWSYLDEDNTLIIGRLVYLPGYMKVNCAINKDGFYEDSKHFIGEIDITRMSHNDFYTIVDHKRKYGEWYVSPYLDKYRSTSTMQIELFKSEQDENIVLEEHYNLIREAEEEEKEVIPLPQHIYESLMTDEVKEQLLHWPNSRQKIDLDSLTLEIVEGEPYNRKANMLKGSQVGEVVIGWGILVVWIIFLSFFRDTGILKIISFCVWLGLRWYLIDKASQRSGR